MPINPTNFPNGITGPIVASDGTQASAITDLTDSSGGTANDIIAEITEASTAGSADTAPVAGAIADLAAKVNAILAALRSSGVIAE